MTSRIVIHPYRDEWPRQFHEVGQEIRVALGHLAAAIHHIGSTAVPGLDAKDIIDVQVTVADFETSIRAPLEAIGYRFREDVTSDHLPPGQMIAPSDLEKLYFHRSADGAPRVHLHVRAQGRHNTRYALLCRDYLRVSPSAREAYAVIKRQLARYFPDNSEAYYDIKDPVFDVLMAGAFVWAEVTGWDVPASDV